MKPIRVFSLAALVLTTQLHAKPMLVFFLAGLSNMQGHAKVSSFILITALLFASQSVVRAADDLVVYPPVPGLAASEHYKVRVRSASDGSKWQKAFAFVTTCKTIEKKTDGYFDHLAGWTHTYVNFETSGAVEIEIARANGEPIHTAAVHPRRKASRVRWRKARQSSG